MLSAALGLIATCLAGLSIWLSRAPVAPVELRIGQRRQRSDRRLGRRHMGFSDGPNGRKSPRRVQAGRRIWDQRRLILGEDITAALQRESG